MQRRELTPEQKYMIEVTSKRSHVKTLAMALWDAVHDNFDGPALGDTKEITTTKDGQRQTRTVQKGREYRARHALFNEVLYDFKNNKQQGWRYKRSQSYRAYWDFLTIMQKIVMVRMSKVGFLPVAEVAPAPRAERPKQSRAPSTAVPRPTPVVERQPVRVEAPPAVSAPEVEPTDDPDDDAIAPIEEETPVEVLRPRSTRTVSTTTKTPAVNREQVRLERRGARRAQAQVRNR